MKKIMWCGFYLCFGGLFLINNVASEEQDNELNHLLALNSHNLTTCTHYYFNRLEFYSENDNKEFDKETLQFLAERMLDYHRMRYGDKKSNHMLALADLINDDMIVVFDPDDDGIKHWHSLMNRRCARLNAQIDQIEVKIETD